MPREDNGVGSGGVEVLGDGDVEGEDIREGGRVNIVERRVGRIDSNMSGRSVSTAVLIASCDSSAGAMDESGDTELGVVVVVVVVFSVNNVVGESRRRFASWALGRELLPTTSHVNECESPFQVQILTISAPLVARMRMAR